MRRQPCWSCGRLTSPVELLATNVDAGPTSRLGWWLAAGSSGCAPLRRPAQAAPSPSPRKEVTLP
jgi:hypothetical protein